MEVEVAGAELCQLAEPPSDREPLDRMPAQIFQHAADEVAHVDQRVVGKIVETLYSALRSRAGSRRDVGEAGGAGNIYPAMDGMDPGGAGIRNDNTGRTEDGQSPDDSQPRVHRLFRKP